MQGSVSGAFREFGSDNNIFVLVKGVRCNHRLHPSGKIGVPN